MTEDERSPAQRTLIEAIRRIEELPLGPSEPALTYRLRNWAAEAVDAFDLEAAMESSLEEEPAEDSRGPDEVSTSAPGKPAPALSSGSTDPRGSIDLSVIEIASSVAQRAADSTDLARRAIARIREINPELNAVVTLTANRALEEARVVELALEAGEHPGPLAGVPILHKDIICTRGVRTTAGSRLLSNYVPSEDAAVVVRLAEAGALTVGKSNTHEFATGTSGTVSSFGPTRNPWNTAHLAGGSSSGSAAGVAAGLVPAATGTDTGGSIRIPSACCGVVGLKPTYGRVSRVGVIPFAWSLDHVGPIGRSVADVAALLKVIAGHDPIDPASADEPLRLPDFFTRGDLDSFGTLAGTRFAVPAEHFSRLAREEVEAAVADAASVLERLGAQRVEVELPEELGEVGPAAVAIFLAEGGAVHARTLQRSPNGYQRETLAFLSLADEVSGRAYVQAQRLRARLATAMARVLRSADLLLTPTLPITAPPIETKRIEGRRGPVDVRAALTLFTRPFNLTGLPALSVPCGFGSDGMPIGLQIVGRPFDEGTILRAGHAYERAAGSAASLPPVSFAKAL